MIVSLLEHRRGRAHAVGQGANAHTWIDEIDEGCRRHLGAPLLELLRIFPPPAQRPQPSHRPYSERTPAPRQ